MSNHVTQKYNWILVKTSDTICESFFRDSSGQGSHRFDQLSNQDHLTANRNDEVNSLWNSRQKM